MLIASLIFLLTIILVIWQPKGLGVGWSATLGAVLALLSGAVHVSDIAVVWQIIWNATGTFVALIIISLLLDEAGFFAWAALHVARWGRGSGRKLFAFMVLLGALVSALFANDGAALILTPIVISMLLALRFSPAATLAFVMGAGFIADTASLPRGWVRSSCADSSASSTSARMRRARSRNRAPASVSMIERVVLCNSRTPIRSSSAATRRVTTDGER